MAYILKTENMTVGYDGKPLIRNIEIAVEPGKIVTLIGPNGAGKSTILKSLTKQLKLVGGKVSIADEDLEAIDGRRLAQRMSVVLTERIRPELMTCEDVVSTGRYPYTGRLGILSDKDREIVRESMRMVKAESLADRDFESISDGQRQRVLLARALCQQPEIIILDEPTSFLDIRHKMELLSILKKLVREQSLAVVMSLHELDLAQKVSDTVVCVRGDVIDRCGSVEEVFTETYIDSLFEMTTGHFSTIYGVPEFSGAEGEPEVFVIGGGGAALNTYRRLQREGIPFCAGILQENDVEYPAARTLASEVVSVGAFETIDDNAIESAKRMIDRCKTVLCPLRHFGVCNARLTELLEYAGEKVKDGR